MRHVRTGEEEGGLCPDKKGILRHIDEDVFKGFRKRIRIMDNREGREVYVIKELRFSISATLREHA